MLILGLTMCGHSWALPHQNCGTLLPMTKPWSVVSMSASDL